MKKIFVALMAVLVLASCGGNKKEAANAENQNTTEVSAVSPAEVIMMTAEIMNNAAASLEKVTTADEMIDATAELYAEMKKLQENYGDIMAAVDTLSEEEVSEMYPAEMEAMQEAAINYSVIMMGKAELMENLTPEQEARFMEILETEL